VVRQTLHHPADGQQSPKAGLNAPIP